MSDETNDTNQYIPAGYRPHATHFGDAYFKAQEEMLLPAPATNFISYPKLQLMTGGLRPYEFSILCGSTGTGKTTLCANWSNDLLQQGVSQFVASVETGHTDYAKRMISAQAGQDWNTGDPVKIDALRVFNEQHLTKFSESKSWLSLYDNRAPIENLMADIAYMVATHGTKIAIIDNLNFFMEVTAKDKAIVEMDRVIHELIIFCKRVPVHVIMVMHPAKTDNGRVDSELDIKGSSTAVQEAHNVFLFNRPHPDLIKAGRASENDREIVIAKMRRRGKYVRRRLLLRPTNCVRYTEGDLF